MPDTTRYPSWFHERGACWKELPGITHDDLPLAIKQRLADYDAKCAEVDALKVRLADIRSTIMGYGKVWEAIERLSRPDAQKDES